MKGQLRLLHILGELKPSGAELMYAAAADLWRAKGLECEILSTGQTTGAMTSRLGEAGYRIHHIPFRRSTTHVIDVYNFLRKQRFDVVHVNGESASFWYSVAAYAAGTRRLFRTIHNVFPFTGMLRLRRKLQRCLMRWLGVRMLAISPSVKTTELQHFANPTALVPNWFDDRVYLPPTPEQRATARAHLKIAPTTVVLTSVAGCWPYKNHSAILRAFAKFLEDIDVIYLHVGMEGADLEERKLASELGISGRVRFFGVVPDTIPILHASDIYLMPSLYEGFGCAAVEAMATGLPTILSNVAGLRDFAAICQGIVFVQPTPESIASGIRQLLTMTAEERHAIGLRLSAATHKHFGLSNGALTYACMYIGRNGNG